MPGRIVKIVYTFACAQPSCGEYHIEKKIEALPDAQTLIHPPGNVLCVECDMHLFLVNRDVVRA